MDQRTQEWPMRGCRPFMSAATAVGISCERRAGTWVPPRGSAAGLCGARFRGNASTELTLHDRQPRAVTEPSTGPLDPGRIDQRIHEWSERGSREEASDLGPTMHIELLEKVVDVVLDRRHLDPQAIRDLFVRQILSYQTHDLTLSRGQTPLTHARVTMSCQCIQSSQEAGRHPRCAPELCARRALYRGHEILYGLLPSHVAGNPRFGPCQDVRFV